MRRRFKSLTGVLNEGARVHYIIGSSTFYGVLVPSDHICAEMLSALGFAAAECAHQEAKLKKGAHRV